MPPLCYKERTAGQAGCVSLTLAPPAGLGTPGFLKPWAGGASPRLPAPVLVPANKARLPGFPFFRTLPPPGGVRALFPTAGPASLPPAPLTTPCRPFLRRAAAQTAAPRLRPPGRRNAQESAHPPLHFGQSFAANPVFPALRFQLRQFPVTGLRNTHGAVNHVTGKRS